MASSLTRVLTLSSRCALSTRISLMKGPPTAVSSIMMNRYVQSASHDHNHSKLWGIERMVSAGILAAIPASFMFPIPGADYAIALALVMHVHWGLEAIVVDYIRPKIFGPAIPKVALGLLYLLSALSLGGLFYFNYSDVGLVQGTKMAWNRL